MKQERIDPFWSVCLKGEREEEGPTEPVRHVSGGRGGQGFPVYFTSLISDVYASETVRSQEF